MKELVATITLMVAFVMGCASPAAPAVTEPKNVGNQAAEALVQSISATTSTQTPTPLPTWTPTPTSEPTATPTLTPTALPTLTATAEPTPSPTPTTTPTATPEPTPTPRPTWTPKPSPTPTRTPRPTIPTWTPTPVVSLSEKLDVRTMLGVDAAHEESRATTLDRLIVVGCYAGLRDFVDGEDWFTFSKDGEFSRDRIFISVTGLSKDPKRGQCYEMLVRYEREANYCYYFQQSNEPRPSLSRCPGWRQMTREFYLLDESAWRLITKNEWRHDYLDTYAR